MNLFEIAEEYRYAASKLVDLEIDEQTVTDTLESVSGDLVEKGKNIAFVIRNLESASDQITDAIAAMKKRSDSMRKRADRMREFLLAGMSHAGIKEITCPFFTIRSRQNPESVDVYEEALIPREFYTDPKPPEPTVDKNLIKKAIKDGYEVPGVKLVKKARLEIK